MTTEQSPRRILVVDDEAAARTGLERILGGEGYLATSAANGEEAIEVAKREAFDAVITDLRMPGISGIELIAELRELSPHVPVVVATAFGDVQSAVQAMRAGADDYVTKPFSPKELVARVRALLRRRVPEAGDEAVEVAGLRLEPQTFRVIGDGQPLRMGPTEFRLLHYLMRNVDRVLSRGKLLDGVWGDHVFIEERTVDVHIRRLRLALQPSGHDRLIETVRGGGYRFLPQ